MGDFNICENINELMQQQLRIRHLLNYLRNSQNNCNDVDCITNDIQLPADESFDMLSLLLLMALMFGALFTLIRPNLVKNRKQDFNNQDDDNDDNSRPVQPPTH